MLISLQNYQKKTSLTSISKYTPKPIKKLQSKSFTAQRIKLSNTAVMLHFIVQIENEKSETFNEAKTDNKNLRFGTAIYVF